MVAGVTPASPTFIFQRKVLDNMKLTGEEARNVVYDDHDDWKPVEGTEEQCGHNRWTVDYTGIFQHIPSGKFYCFCWDVGATEHQEQCAYENQTEVEAEEVVKKLIQTEQWVSPEAPGLIFEAEA